MTKKESQAEKSYEAYLSQLDEASFGDTKITTALTDDLNKLSENIKTKGETTSQEQNTADKIDLVVEHLGGVSTYFDLLKQGRIDLISHAYEKFELTREEIDNLSNSQDKE